MAIKRAPVYTKRNTMGITELSRFFGKSKSSIKDYRRAGLVPIVPVAGQQRTPRAWAEENRARFHPESAGQRIRIHQGPLAKRTRQTPEGTVTFTYVEDGSGGRWKGQTMRRALRENRWRQFTGTPKSAVVHDGRFHYVKTRYADKMIADSLAYPANMYRLARALGYRGRALKTQPRVKRKKKIGGQWHTTADERRRLFRRKRLLENTQSNEDLAGRFGVDRHTFLRWVDAGLIPYKMDNVVYRVPNEFVDLLGEYVKDPNGERHPLTRRMVCNARSIWNMWVEEGKLKKETRRLMEMPDM